MSTLTNLINQVASISVSSSGDNVGIAGVSGKVIEVHALALTFASPVTVTFKDGSTVLGTYVNTTSITLDELHRGFRYLTGTGNNFTISLSSAVVCSGNIWFSQR